MVTHTFSLDEAAEAFQTATSRTGEAIKVLIAP
jgi:threonine dehydrogenase-like Zn-dependent dehydrogenase